MTEQIINEHVRSQDRKNKGGFNVMSARVPMDYDMIKDKKVKNYTDHKGNYITKTGHLIDDYLLNENNDKVSKDLLDKFRQAMQKRVDEHRNS